MNFYSPRGKFFSNFRENKFTRYFQFAIISLSTQARRFQTKLSFDRRIKDKERRWNEEEQGKWKEGSSVSFSLSRSSSRVFLTRVTRPLSGFQIRNTLGAEGFPIFPLFIARASGYQDYRIRRETEEFRCNPPTETSGVRAPGTFLGDASSIFENQEKTWKKCKLKMKSYCWRRFVFEPLILINLHFLPLSYISAQNVHHPFRRITVR